MKALNKIVVKVGTSTLTQGTKTLSRHYMLGLVRQIVELKSQGIEVVLVSSGAVSTGRDLLSSLQTSLFPHAKEMFASIGQVKLMQIWSELFSLFTFRVGQVLLTKNDFSESNTLHTRGMLNCLLENGVIPIANENDTVAVGEIRIGDNDNLAALIAKSIEADTIVLLTDQKGLYTSDPHLHSDARLIRTVKAIDESIFAFAKGSSSSFGTGGMTTKIEAAQVASHSGIQTLVVSAAIPNVLLELAKGNQVGTLFSEGKTTCQYHNNFKVKRERV